MVQINWTWSNQATPRTLYKNPPMPSSQMHSSPSSCHPTTSPLSEQRPLMAGFFSVALGALLFMTCATWGLATDFNVGDSTGWTTNYDYSTWTSGKTFTVGDNLVFNFATGSHTVTEVSSSDYSSCSSSNAISNTNTGPATIQLKTSGEHYFICTVAGHCSSGMKLAVTVTASGSPTTPSPPSNSSRPTPSPPSNTTGSHASVTRGFAPASAVAVLAGLMVTLF